MGPTKVAEIEGELATVPLSEVKMDEGLNCRGVIPLADLMELAEDIQQNGLLQPVLLRHRHEDEAFTEPYVLVAGFSRTKAIRDIVRGETITAVIRHLTKRQCIVLNAAENLKRRELNLMQEAESIRRLVRSGMTREDICKELGKTTGWVQPRMYLLQLPEPVQRIAAAGFLTTDNIRKLYSLNDDTDRLAIAKKIKSAKQQDSRSRVEVKAFATTAGVKRNRARVSHHRTKAEIMNLQDYLEDIKFPFGIHMSFLAWAGGLISDIELMARIQTHFMELGRDDYFPDAMGIPDMKEGARIL